MMIAETSFWDYTAGDSIIDLKKNLWIKQVYNPKTLDSLKKIKLINWFHVNKKEGDFRIPNNSDVYKKCISNPIFGNK